MPDWRGLGSGIWVEGDVVWEVKPGLQIVFFGVVNGWFCGAGEGIFEGDLWYLFCKLIGLILKLVCKYTSCQPKLKSQ